MRAPQGQEGLLGIRAIDRTNRLGDIDRVRVKRACCCLELGIASTQRRIGCAGGQEGVLLQLPVERCAQDGNRRIG